MPSKGGIAVSPKYLIPVILLLLMGAHLRSGENALPVLDVPYAAVKPSLEAKAGDPAWQKATVLPDLSLSRVSPEGDQAKPTEVRLLWDEQFLYVRFDCKDDGLHLPEAGRDAQLYRGDVVQVFIDPKGDGRQMAEVLCNANNDVLDMQILLTDEPRSDENLMLQPDVREHDYWACLDWNMEGLKTAAAKEEKDGKLTGWTVEMAIPAKAVLRRLGLVTFRPMTLRANLLRYDWQPPPVENQKWSLVSMNWAPVLHGSPHYSPAAMGFLKLRPKLPDAPGTK